MIDPLLHTLIAVGLAALFGSAVFNKVRAPSAFVTTVAEYRVVPELISSATAVLIIFVELAVAVGLLWPSSRRVSGGAGAILLIVYAVAIAVNLRRGRFELDCGCTLHHRPIGRWMVTRNSVLAAASAALVIPVSNREIQLSDVVTILAALCVITLLYASADLLLGGTRQRR